VILPILLSLKARMMLCTVEVDKQKMGPSGRLISQRGWHASGWNLGYPHYVAYALSSEPKLEATHIVVQKIILKGEFKWTMWVLQSCNNHYTRRGVAPPARCLFTASGGNRVVPATTRA